MSTQAKVFTVNHRLARATMIEVAMAREAEVVTAEAEEIAVEGTEEEAIMGEAIGGEVGIEGIDKQVSMAIEAIDRQVLMAIEVRGKAVSTATTLIHRRQYLIYHYLLRLLHPGHPILWDRHSHQFLHRPSPALILHTHHSRRSITSRTARAIPLDRLNIHTTKVNLLPSNRTYPTFNPLNSNTASKAIIRSSHILLSLQASMGKHHHPHPHRHYLQALL